MLNNLINISNQKYKFIDSDFKSYIINVINNFFPILNTNDKYILNILTIFLIDLICYKYNFIKNNSEYINQWKQNNNRDIKSVLLLLLPFIDDKNNNELLNKLTDLNHLLYSKNELNINNNLIKLNRNQELFEEYFKFGNMGIGLLNKSDTLLKLYNNNDKLIYKIIYHNLLGLLQSLEIMNGKYYINWINIIPFNLNNYYDSNFYNITVETINKITIEILPTLSLNYNGLWIGDYYNILKIKFYEELKKIKWLIFPYEINTNKYYLINKLNDLIDLDFIINCNYNNYYECSNNEKITFYNKCKLIDINIDNNNEIIKYLLIYLINNSNDNVFNKYHNFKLNIDEDNDIKEYNKESRKIIKNITNKLIKITFEEIINNNIAELWDFLNETIKKLKNTSIYKYLTINNKIDKNNYYYKPFNNTYKINSIYINHVENKLNLKNIYNIAKSLSHNNLQNWKKLQYNFLSLTINDKINFFNKINNYENYESWINLMSNLKKQYNNFKVADYKNKMVEILKAFYYIYHNIIFEELITNGLLSNFHVNLNITNKQILPQDFLKMKRQRKKLTKEMFEKNKENFNESYYYLTNDKYKNLNKIKSNHNIKLFENYNEYNYFELIYEDQEWIFFYAMDWIAQINFFYHYIYHQVLYITGAPGQGKSTQLPKLLLYALKVIDYKNNGKVICTEPRIPPTYNNSSRISLELGVPLDEITDNPSIKIKTNNYYIQYKHSEDQHYNNNINYGYIRISTDGTLYEELKKNIIMKKIINENKYINENIYDIIMIDESHEHGTNMDLIISLSRNTCILNNQIRLIITSATMDDDEPIYRRYFKIINDKLLFPIKNKIIDPFTNKLLLLNPEYMDRRFHISPPGETTQYKVDEYYLDEELLPKNKLLTNKEYSNEIQQIGYEKIIEICNKYPTGEILFFANGKNEILKAVKYLNKYIPNNDIALPYFSELHSNYKTIIEKIDTKISTIKNKKENIFTEWDANFIEDQTVINGIYKRAIIIATNIAEASLTIPRLTFVIDNGYAKVNKYFEIFNQYLLEVDYISESSRLQRKGRVGRIGDGKVYYLYQKDARKNIKPKYKITEENFSNIFISLLLDNNFYIESIYNPNNILFHIRKIEKTNDFIFDSNLYDIYINNYSINENNIIEYFYNDDHDIFKYINDKNLIKDNIRDLFKNDNNINYNIYLNGLSFESLLDQDCKFYLMHYYENNIMRNILNEIIFYKDTENIFETSQIKISHYKYLLVNLLNNNLIVDNLYNKINELDYYITIPNMDYVKTELYNYIKFLIQYDYINNIENAITLLFSYLLKCYNEVFELLIFFSIVKNLDNLIIKKDIYLNNNKSEIIIIYNIINEFKLFFNDLFIFNKEMYNDDIEIDINNKYILNKINFLKRNNLFYNKNGTINYDNLKTSKLFYKNNNYYILFLNNIKNNEEEIKNWCDKNYIKSSVIIQYLYKLIDIKIENHINIIYDKFNTYNLSDIMASLISINKEDNIIKSFLYGNPTNICYYIDNKMVSFKFDVLTILNSEELINKNNILFYLFYDIDENIYINKSIKISIVNNIDIKWLISGLPLYYNLKIFGPQTNPKINNININSNNLLTFNIISNEIINNWNENMIIWNNKNFPLLNNYYKNILKLL
jgi:hypothetical protein